METPDEIYYMNYRNEVAAFSGKHQSLMASILKLNSSADKIFLQIQLTTDNRLGIVISQLTRICNRHFEAILLLATTGHGHSVVRILRSLFEKAVDAKFLHIHPNELDDFIDYYIVQMHDRGQPSGLPMPNNSGRFRFKNGNLRPRWSKQSVSEKAKAVDMQPLLDNAYKYGHLLIHSSMHEVLGSLIIEDDGSLSPATPEQHQEHDLAYIGLLASATIMVNVLDFTIKHFELVEPEEFEEFQQSLIESVKGIV